MAKAKLSKKVNNEVKKFVAALEADHLPISQVFVFGSSVKGSRHKWSDIDVCVVSSKFSDPFHAIQYLWTKRPHDTGLTIEPIGFHPSDFRQHSILVDEIKRTGVKFQ